MFSPIFSRKWTKEESANLAHLAWLYLALYLSEGWYAGWVVNKRPSWRALAIVAYDRSLNGEQDRFLRGTHEA
jgi:hypothetical protein